MLAHTLNGGCCRLQPVVGVRMAQYAPILQPRRHHGRTAQLSRSASADTLATVEGQRPGDWLACVEQLQAQLGCSEADAEVYVQRAFGWGARARAYWRHEKSEQPPDLQQLLSALDFLAQLGMEEDQVTKTVRAFPEVLGCDVDTQLQSSVDKLSADWKLQGDVLVKALLRQPPVLGYNLDCGGDCAGECNRCWARF